MPRSKSKANAPGMIESRSSMLHTQMGRELMHTDIGPAPAPHSRQGVSKSAFLPDPFCALCQTFPLMAPRDPTET